MIELEKIKRKKDRKLVKNNQIERVKDKKIEKVSKKYKTERR